MPDPEFYWLYDSPSRVESVTALCSRVKKVGKSGLKAVEKMSSTKGEKQTNK